MVWPRVAGDLRKAIVRPEDYSEYAERPLEFLQERLGFFPDVHQAKIFDQHVHRGLLLCTRQFGKSTTLAAVAVHRACVEPGSLVVVVSPTARQSGEFLTKASLFLDRLGIGKKTDGVHALSRVLPNGSRILGLPDVEATVRGYSARLVLVDEASRVCDEVMTAVRPMLAATNGDLWMITTPAGKRGMFYREWVGDGRWFRLKVTAPECGRILTSFLDEERQAHGDLKFRQEYLCEFVDTHERVFEEDWIQAMLVDDGEPLKI